MIQDSYYGTQIENRRQAFEWYQFQWSWVTSNPDFKVTILFVAPLFNAEYLRNGTRYRHSYNEILLGTYAFLKIDIFNDLDVRCYSANIMSNVKEAMLTGCYDYFCGRPSIVSFVLIVDGAPTSFTEQGPTFVNPALECRHQQTLKVNTRIINISRSTHHMLTKYKTTSQKAHKMSILLMPWSILAKFG